jgi:hypothetical protein
MKVIACTPRGHQINLVWHCEKACELRNVIWADDETMEYCEYSRKPVYPAELIVRQAKKIVITDTVIYINPLDDPEERVTRNVSEEIESCEPL